MGIFHDLRGDTAVGHSAVKEWDRSEPVIGPGQVWLIECDAGSLSALHAGLLLHANVVLYERALGTVLAETLPTGIYAEPLPAGDAAGPVIAPRARSFAAEGWSVVQLVERRDGQGQFMQFAAQDRDQPDGGASPGPRSAAPGQIFTANGLAG